MGLQRTHFEPEHEQFRDTCREFLARHVTPHHDQWEADGLVDRQVYVEAAKQGVLGFNIPEEFGGGGVEDWRFNQVLGEETCKAFALGPMFGLQTDVLAPYMLHQTNDEQKARWLPSVANG